MQSQILIDDPDFTVSGRATQTKDARRAPAPLIIAVHGGGFTSGYFDVPGHSLLDHAESRAVDVIAVDRLGHGRSGQAKVTNQSLEANVAWLDRAIARLWSAFQDKHTGIVLVSHSIGAAVSLMLAARAHTAWPLLGVAVSGTGMTPNAALDDYFEHLPTDAWMEPASESKDRMMFGPPTTFDARSLDAVHAAYRPVATRELHEIHHVWPGLVRLTLQAVTVPVHIRLAAHEAFYFVDEAQVDKINQLLVHADSSVAIIESTGHCIDFHHAGAQFHAEQLDFAMRCALRA